VKTLSVLYNGWGEQFTLGRLAEDRANLIFEYSQEAIGRNLELSPLKLKLGPASYSGFPVHQERLPGLIADSLPDGWGRLLMDRFFNKRGLIPQGVSVLDRLAFIGDRAMGALSFVPETQGKLSAEDISLLEMANEVQQVIAERDTAALLKLAYLGGSPHGARPKVLVNYDPATMRVSTETTTSGIPLLVKFPGAYETPESCLLEYCYSRMAIDCGLVMPATFYFPLAKNMAAFGIQRFDREDGFRVPVLTVAGALDVDFRVPNADYSTLLSLTGFMTQDAGQVHEAFKRCVFNVLFNNRDDHTKNFSFRMNRAGMWKWPQPTT
jgi:serine/threonine-protein kinase HipA